MPLPAGAGPARRGSAARAASAATLTCRRPRAWAAALAAAAAALVVVALARRLRPPPPRSLSLPPPPGLMRDPRCLLRKPRPGPPKTRRPSLAAAVCPRWGGGEGRAAGRELLRRGAEGGAAARCRRERGVDGGEASVGAEDGRLGRRPANAGGGMRERAKGEASGGWSWRRGRKKRRPCRLLESPRAPSHHLGRNTDLATAAQDGRTGWAGGVSRQAARASRTGDGSGPGREDAGRGRAARAGGRRAREDASPRPSPGRRLCPRLPPGRRRRRRGGWEGEVVRGCSGSPSGAGRHLGTGHKEPAVGSCCPQPVKKKGVA